MRALLALVVVLPLGLGTTAGSAPKDLSCWGNVSTGDVVCVDTGDDLVAAVAEHGVRLRFTAPATVSGRSVAASPVAIAGAAGAGALVKASAVSAAAVETVVSIIYADINYGGASFVMSESETTSCVGSSWTWGYAKLSPYGWNDRASSLRSYAGCRTSLYVDENYDYNGSATSSNIVSLATNKTSLGNMNDRASSWLVRD